MISLDINHHYSFSVYANSILGTNYRNARLVSTLDYRRALKYDNIVLQHSRIFPYLPPGTPEDSTKYTYYLFEVNGKEKVLADVWIDQTSVVLSTGVDHTLRLINVTNSQFTMVRDQLRLLGITFTVS